MSSEFSSLGMSRSPMCEALTKAIRTSLENDKLKSFTNLVLYTSFGVVHGRVKRDDSVSSTEGGLESISQARFNFDIIELDDAEVEHLSNHLPPTHFSKLYINIEDINAFAFESSPQQFPVNI